MKPSTPLRVLGEGWMKPATPSRAENGLKLTVLWEHRCQRFHFVAVIHPHWCHRFQTRQPTGVLWRLWHPSARKNSPSRGGFWVRPRQNSPCWRKSADFGVFCACWASFVPPGRWWSRAGRVFSRLWGRGGTGMKEKPPLREVLWGAVKYSSPLHAEKCCILPILSEQGRYFFH